MLQTFITIIISLLVSASIAIIVYYLTIRFFRKDEKEISKHSKSHEILFYYSAPFLTLLAALLTLSVLFTQYKAIERQKEISSVEQFDRYFFRFLDTHDDCISKIKICNETGREALFYMYWEYRALLYILKNTVESDTINKIDLPFKDAASIAFTCFYGIAN